MPNELSEWLNSIPTVTRHWFLISTVIPLLGRFGLISAQWMYLDLELVIYKFHFWRPITALIYYPVTPQTGFHWLLMVYFLYNYSKNLEGGVFSGRPADFLYMLIINWLVCTGLCAAFNVYFLLDPMVLSVLYVWCQLNKETMVSFWFGMRFKAMYLPWVLCGFNAVIRGSGLYELIGIFVGHVYYFLAFKYPAEFSGISLIQTPGFLYKLLPNEEGGIHGMDGRQRAPRPQPRGHDWGQGVPLGGNE